MSDTPTYTVTFGLADGRAKRIVGIPNERGACLLASDLLSEIACSSIVRCVDNNTVVAAFVWIDAEVREVPHSVVEILQRCIR